MNRDHLASVGDGTNLARAVYSAGHAAQGVGIPKVWCTNGRQKSITSPVLIFGITFDLEMILLILNFTTEK